MLVFRGLCLLGDETEKRQMGRAAASWKVVWWLNTLPTYVRRDIDRVFLLSYVYRCPKAPCSVPQELESLHDAAVLVVEVSKSGTGVVVV